MLSSHHSEILTTELRYILRKCHWKTVVRIIIPVNKQDILKRPLDLYISKKKNSALAISLILLCRSGFQEHSVKDFHLKTQTQDDFCKKCFEPQVSII